MSEVRVRTLEEIKAAKVAQAAQPSSAAPKLLSSSAPAPSPPVKKYGQWKAGLEAVLSAARAGKTDRVRQLLTEHTSLRLDHADADQYSLLHGLAQHNHPALIALLLEKGLHEKGAKAQCLDAVDKWRVTPLMLASCNGNGECALLLLRHGAAAETADHKGLTAEDHAKKHGQGAVLRAIREVSAPKRKRPPERSCRACLSGGARSTR